MKRFVVVCLTLLCLCAAATAQIPQSLSQSWTETVTLAPPPLLNSQSFSSATATGFSTSTVGGSIAAGTYRCGVTFYTATNTETPLSTDTAATSTITTLGSTSTVTIAAPLAIGTGGNVVGWRPYCGVTAGASGAETVVTINSTVCALSSSSTPSCALTSPAVLTLQSQFAAGAGGPATPGTAIFPPVTNAVNTALFENSAQTFRSVYWVVSGTAPSACTLNFQTGATPAALANVAAGSGGQTVTCTSTGSFSLPSNATSVYSAINLATYTAGDTTTKTAFYYITAPFNPDGYQYFGNAAPTSTCTVGFTFLNGAGTQSLQFYACNAGTWIAITVP